MVRRLVFTSSKLAVRVSSLFAFLWVNELLVLTSSPSALVQFLNRQLLPLATAFTFTLAFTT